MIRSAALILLVIVTSLGLSACPGSDSLCIPELSLPEGASIVRRTNSLSQHQFDRLPIAYNRLCISGQQIFFSCSQDWNSVAGHIDQTMVKLGYNNQEDLYHGAQVRNLPGDYPKGENPAEFIRCYWQDNREYAVLLLNFEHKDGREYLSYIDGAPSAPVAQYGLYLVLLQPGVSPNPYAEYDRR